MSTNGKKNGNGKNGKNGKSYIAVNGSAPKKNIERKYTDDFIEQEAGELEKYAEGCTGIPFICEFARKRKLHREYISRFANWNEKFGDALELMKQIQEYKLVVLGLSGKINPTMAIFTLKNVAGWRDNYNHEVKGEIRVGLRSLIEHVYHYQESEKDRKAGRPKLAG